MSQTSFEIASVAASSTNALVRAAFTLSTLARLELLASRDCRLRTNSPGVDAVKSISTTPTVSSGTFTATVNGATTGTIAYDAAASAVQTALRGLATVGTQGVTCTGGPLPGTPVVCIFAGPLAAQPVTMSVNGGSLGGGGSIAVADSTVGVAPGDTLYLIGGKRLVWEAGVDQVWTVTISGTPTGGTFTLSYAGQTTSGINHNAAASTVQTALQGLSTVGSGNLLVTGSNGGPYTVTAAGSLAGRPLDPLIAVSSLTGGTSPTVAVAIATQGRRLTANPFTADVTAFYVTATDPTTIQLKTVRN